MKDNQIYLLVKQLIDSSLLSFDFGYVMPTINVIVVPQPTEQAAFSSPTIIIQKLFDKKLGSPFKKDEWVGSSMVHTETQQMESAFQCSAMYIQKQGKIDQPTASDLCGAVSTILQSDNAIQFLQNNNLGIYKISEIRNTIFQDEKNRQESSPSFDFTLTHKNTTLTSSPTASTIEAGIFSV